MEEKINSTIFQWRWKQSRLTWIGVDIIMQITAYWRKGEQAVLEWENRGDCLQKNLMKDACTSRQLELVVHWHRLSLSSHENAFKTEDIKPFYQGFLLWIYLSSGLLSLILIYDTLLRPVTSTVYFSLLNPIAKLWLYIVKQYTKAYNVYQFVKVIHLKNADYT